MSTSDGDLVAQAAVDELGRLSFAEHSLDSVLRRVTAPAAGVLLGEPVISLTILGENRPTTVAATGDVALQLDLTQYRQGGPAPPHASTGRTAEIVDTRSADYAVALVSNVYLEHRGARHRRAVRARRPPRRRLSGGMNSTSGGRAGWAKWTHGPRDRRQPRGPRSSGRDHRPLGRSGSRATSAVAAGGLLADGC